MKKNVIWLFFLITSCSLFENPTTVEVINNSEYSKNDAVPEMNGTLYDVMLYEFRGDDIVEYTEIGNLTPVNGTSGYIEVDPEIEKVRVAFKLFPDDSQAAQLLGVKTLYTLVAYYPEKGELTTINIDGSTRVTDELKTLK